jgi:hypothetical protein
MGDLWTPFHIVHAAAMCCALVAGLGHGPFHLNQGKVDQKQVTVVYDKATGETIVRSPLLQVREVPGTIEERTPKGTVILPSETLEMMAHFSFPGKTFVRAEFVVISFLSLAQGEYKYSQDTEVRVRADALSLDLGKVVVADRRADSDRGLASPGFFREALQVAVPAEKFFQMVSASRIKIKVGNVDFSLSANQIKSLRALAVQAGQ